MAELESVTHAIAAVDGRSPAVIDAHVVRLRAAGLVGTKAATPRDAANIMIGINAGVAIDGIAETTATFRSLTPRLVSTLDSERFVPDSVNDAHDLGEVIEALIADAPALERSFREFVAAQMAEDPAAVLGSVGILDLGKCIALHVQLHSGGPHRTAGALRVDTFMARLDPFRRRKAVREKLFEMAFVPLPHGDTDELGIDREVSVVLGLRTFLAVHEALFGARDRNQTSERHVPRYDQPRSVQNVVALATRRNIDGA